MLRWCPLQRLISCCTCVVRGRHADGPGRQRSVPDVLLDEPILDVAQDGQPYWNSVVVVVVVVAFLAVDTNAAVSSWMVDRLEEGGEVHVAAALVQDGRGTVRTIVLIWVLILVVATKLVVIPPLLEAAGNRDAADAGCAASITKCVSIWRRQRRFRPVIGKSEEIPTKSHFSECFP